MQNKDAGMALVCAGILLFTAARAGGEDIRYSTHIKKLFDDRCVSCHGKDAPEHDDFKKDREGFKKKGLGPKMDSYAHLASYAGWPDSGAIMRRLDDGKNTKDGKAGNMYEYLGANEEERQRNLGLFKAWVGVWTLKRFSELTREELAGITVKY
ncbi:MAG: cytochrome C [Nitrospirota bacterium]|nr:cytochrome C [Nitrospirota bacterium]